MRDPVTDGEVPQDGAGRGPPGHGALGLPPGLILAEGIDLEAEDPAREGSRRRCIAERKAGGRCSVVAISGGLVCAAHAGRLDPAVGGRAKAEAQRLATERMENRMAEARLGTRAVIARVFEEQAEQVRATVRLLLGAAAGGDLASAKLLIPYLNQGLGMPGQTLDIQSPQEGTDLSHVPTAELRLLASKPSSHAASPQGQAGP